MVGDSGMAQGIAFIGAHRLAQSMIAIFATVERELVELKILQPLDEGRMDIIVETAAVIGVAPFFEYLIRDRNAFSFE